MAVERMEMVDLVGHMEDVDEIAKRIILSSSVHMVNAITEVQQNNFPILKAHENMDAVLEYNYIRQYASRKSLKDVQDRIDGLMEIFELKKRVILSHLKGEYDFSTDVQKINELYENIEEKHEKLKALNNEIIELLSLERHLIHLRHIGIDLNELMSLKYIK